MFDNDIGKVYIDYGARHPHTANEGENKMMAVELSTEKLSSLTGKIYENARLMLEALQACEIISITDTYNGDEIVIKYRGVNGEQEIFLAEHTWYLNRTGTGIFTFDYGFDHFSDRNGFYEATISQLAAPCEVLENLAWYVDSDKYGDWSKNYRAEVGKKMRNIWCV